jgi:hypothetical protein
MDISKKTILLQNTYDHLPAMTDITIEIVKPWPKKINKKQHGHAKRHDLYFWNVGMAVCTMYSEYKWIQ